jgi:hypothetical protein
MNNNYQKIHDSTSDELHPAPTEMHSTDVLFSPGSPATFPTSRIKASGFIALRLTFQPGLIRAK